MAVDNVIRATDVGMSYGAAAVVVGRDFTDVGHATALVLGMLVSTRFGQPAGWTPTRCLLLVVGSVFGYLMLANTGLSSVVATGLGFASALAAHIAVRSAQCSAFRRGGKPSCVTRLSSADHL